jgi:hypothetical protein
MTMLLIFGIILIITSLGIMCFNNPRIMLVALFILTFWTCDKVFSKTLFEAETGFTELNIKEMRTTFQGIGLSESESDLVIIRLARSLDDLSAEKYASYIYRQLSLAPGGAGLANNIWRCTDLGRKICAVNVLVIAYTQTPSRAGKVFLSRLFDVPIGVMDVLSDMAREGKTAAGGGDAK